jgi:hypothetical protein
MSTSAFAAGTLTESVGEPLLILVESIVDNRSQREGRQRRLIYTGKMTGCWKRRGRWYTKNFDMTEDFILKVQYSI